MLLLSLPVNAQELVFKDSFEDIAIWISQVNGNWSDGLNWKSGSPPAVGEAVIIKVPTNIEVTIGTGPLVVSSIISEELLLINTTLTVNGPILNNGGITMAGTLINADVLPESTHNIGLGTHSTIRNVRMGKTITTGVNRYLTVYDGLTLDGSIRVLGERAAPAQSPTSGATPPTRLTGRETSSSATAAIASAGLQISRSVRTSRSTVTRVASAPARC